VDKIKPRVKISLLQLVCEIKTTPILSLTKLALFGVDREWINLCTKSSP
jgi:hypothetical protein